MADFNQLQRQIADELGDRTDLLSPLADSGLTESPIKNAIRSAIAKWEREPFYFNENYSNFFVTVAGQEFYTGGDAPEIARFPELYHLHVTVNGSRLPLTPRTWAYLDTISIDQNASGEPQDYAVFAKQLRLYPIPNGIYTVTASRTLRPTSVLVNDTDSNFWTIDGVDLIRSEAKLILAREVLMDDDLASRMEIAIYGNPVVNSRGYLGALKAETTRRARSRIIPTQF